MFLRPGLPLNVSCETTPLSYEPSELIIFSGIINLVTAGFLSSLSLLYMLLSNRLERVFAIISSIFESLTSKVDPFEEHLIFTSVHLN